MLAGVDPVFEPLVASDKRTFGTSVAPRPVAPWVYLGVSFTSDTSLTDVKAAPACVTADLDRPVHYCAAAALPAGRYVLVAGARGFVLDFG